MGASARLVMLSGHLLMLSGGFFSNTVLSQLKFSALFLLHLILVPSSWFRSVLCLNFRSVLAPVKLVPSELAQAPEWAYGRHQCSVSITHSTFALCRPGYGANL